MTDWRTRGYVPDSEDEDDDFAAQRVFNPRDKAESTGEGLPKAATLNEDGSSATNGLTSASTDATIIESTADRLEKAIQDGLHLVHGVLTPILGARGLDDSDGNDSPLSSPPLSAIGSPPRFQQSRYAAPSTHAKDSPQSVTKEVLTSSAPRRNLRVRAPIQEHPYMLEDAKYRQLMKDRGLKPVNAPLLSTNTAQVSTAEDSQQTDDFQGSQSFGQYNFNNLDAPSSSKSSSDADIDDISASHPRNLTNPNFEDGLPDLSQLLHEPRSKSKTKAFNEKRAERHRTSASSLDKTVYKPLPEHTADNRYVRASNEQEFRVPPSPPHSDDDLLFDVNNGGLRLSSGGSENTDTPIGLPTPLLSSGHERRKRPLTVISSDESSDSAEEDVTSPSTPREDADDSQGLRWIRQRLRGVLPPSYLKLDMQTQRRTQSRHHNLIASREAMQERGVARRTNLAARSVEYPRSNALLVSEGESSESSEFSETDETQHHSQPIQYMDEELQAPVTIIGSENKTDNLRDRDEIDHMLPSASIKRKNKDSGVFQQQRIDNGWAVTNHRTAADAASAGLISRKMQPSRSDHRRANVKRKRRTVQSDRRPVRMSVLDAPGFDTEGIEAQPQFLRLAAREARRATHQLAQDPSRKFFLLATAGDTQEVNDQIRLWKEKCGNKKVVSVRASMNPTEPRMTSKPSIPSNVDMELTTEQHITHDLDTTTLTGLKRSSDALISKTAFRQDQSTQGIAPKNITSGVLPEADSSNQIEHLKSLFAHRNRSGQGFFLSRRPKPRTAQLETDHVSTMQTTSLPIRTINKPSAKRQEVSMKRQSPRVVTDTGHDRLQTAAQRKRSKQIPKKSNLPTTELDFDTRPPPMESARYNVPANTSLEHTKDKERASNETSHLVQVAVRAVSHLACLSDPSRLFVESLPCTKLLRVINELHNNPLYNPTEPRYSTKLIRNPSRSQSMECGQYNAEVWRIITIALDEVSYTLFRSADEQSLSLDQQTCCVESIASVVEYFVKAWYIPVGTKETTIKCLVNVAHDMGDRIESFVKCCKLRDLQEHTPKRTTILECLNWFATLTLFLHLVLRDTGHSVQATLRQLCENVVAQASEIIVEPFSLEMGLSRLRGLCTNPPACNTDNLPPFPEAESIIIARHVDQILFPSTSNMSFNVHLRSTKVAEQASTWSGRSATGIMMLCFMLPFTQISFEAGTSLSLSESQISNMPFADWLVGQLQELVSTIPLAHASTCCGQLLEAIADFCLKMVRVWHWSPTPAIVTAFLRAYTWNEMLPFNTVPDQNSVFQDFKHLTVCKDLPIDNDFLKFLELVELCMQKMCQTNTDVAGKLRGFVFSLIPNNARGLDARESLQATEFLALKNHFSLYIMLFTRTPEGFHPRFEQLEQQVDFRTSHRLVCELAVTTWQIIASYYMRQMDSAGTRLQAVGDWMNTMLCQSLACFELDRQFGAVNILEKLLSTLATTIISCDAELKSRYLLHGALFNTVDLLLSNTEIHRSNERVIIAGLKVLSAYAHTARSSPVMVTFLSDVQVVLRRIIHQTLSTNTAHNQDLINLLVTTWFAVAQIMVRTSHKNWNDFVEPRSNLSLDLLSGLQESYATHEAKEIFYSNLMEADPSFYFLECRPAVFMTWVTTLLLPVRSMRFEHVLTNSILRYERDSLMIGNLARTLFTVDSSKELTLQEVANSRISILRHIIQNIYGQQFDPEEEWLAGGLDFAVQKELLRTMTKTMKANWMGLRFDPVAQSDYTALVHAILNEMEIYPTLGFTIDPWFTGASEFPRPAQTLDNNFKCRFGTASDEVTRDAITSFRSLYLQALRGSKENMFMQDLLRVFNCTDPLRSRMVDGVTQYSIDLEKQAKFIQIVFPVYIELGSTIMDSPLFNMIVELMTELARRIRFRIDNLNPCLMRKHIVSSTAVLCAVRKLLEQTQFQHHSTPALLQYVRIATSTILSLLEYGIQVDEQLFEMMIGNILGVYYTSCSILPSLLSTQEMLAPTVTLPVRDDSEIEDSLIDREHTVYDAWTDAPIENFDLLPAITPELDGRMNRMIYADAEEPELNEQDRRLRRFVKEDLIGWERFRGGDGWNREEVKQEMMELVRELKRRDLVSEESGREFGSFR